MLRVPNYRSVRNEPVEELSLRDRLALAAVTGAAWNLVGYSERDGDPFVAKDGTIEILSRAAYALADAMIEARDGGGA